MTHMKSLQGEFTYYMCSVNLSNRIYYLKKIFTASSLEKYRENFIPTCFSSLQPRWKISLDGRDR